jgi:hypothetical protein
MGGEQAAMVLALVKREGIERKGGTWSAGEEAEFKRPTLEKYEREGHPLYSSARLWDDGIIDPARSRLSPTPGSACSGCRDASIFGDPERPSCNRHRDDCGFILLQFRLPASDRNRNRDDAVV